jgi:KamA family protein
MSRPSTTSESFDYSPVIPIPDHKSGQARRHLSHLNSGPHHVFPARPFRVFTARQLDNIPQLKLLTAEQRFAMKVVSSVLPFRVNQYVIDSLIDWNNVPEDPIFQLTFPQPGMLAPEHFERIGDLFKKEASRSEIDSAVSEVRVELNPHPAGQQQLNVPTLGNEELEGMQHKYREIVLFFPSQGQTCHSYCTFCFRWAQFVGDKELRFASSEAKNLHDYLAEHPDVTDLLLTGGDPMVMKTRNLADYLDPLARDSRLAHVQTIRIGTKSMTFWPHRFVTDDDADDMLRLLERMVKAGKHVSLMAHYNHWREMDTDIAREAIRRVRETGVVIRSQGPVLANINDDADTWAKTWRTQVKLGIIPYYMFVERDTGARRYFEIPLVKAWEIYRDAMKQVSGLARTARGPSMSAEPGKVEIQGVTEINGEKVFVLRFIQGRNADWVQRPFFAKFDEKATWLNHLVPAFGEEKFFFEDEFQAMKQEKTEATFSQSIS